MTFKQEEERSQDCVAASFRNRIKLCIDVRPTVCHIFFTMFLPSYHHEIFMIYYHAVMSMQKFGGQWSSSQMSKQILLQFGHYWTVTPVLIHRWLCNQAQSLKYVRRGALLIFKVICQISRSHGTKNCRF